MNETGDDIKSNDMIVYDDSSQKRQSPFHSRFFKIKIKLKTETEEEHEEPPRA